jgi:hypothetical protein
MDRGGFSAGYKHEQLPAGLLTRSQSEDRESFIYVAMNYRLGLFVSGFQLDGSLLIVLARTFFLRVLLEKATRMLDYLINAWHWNGFSNIFISLAETL